MKRQMYEVEKKLVKDEIERLKRNRDKMALEFSRDYQMISEAIGDLELLLITGEVEED